MSQKEEKSVWIIGVYNSDGDGIDMYPVKGTTTEVKAHLFRTMKEFAEDYEIVWDGDWREDNVAVNREETYMAIQPWGSDFYVDFCAQKMTEPIDVTL